MLKQMIPYGRQEVTDADIERVVEVLRSDFITQGPVTPEFEQAVSSYCGAEHAVAVNSGTAALHIACLALGLSPGDWLWTSPITFVASANCALYCGANVDFVDIDERTWNMSVSALTQKLEEAERNGKLPKIVIPVHFAGQSCDMQAIKKLAEKYNFYIIEDACHAIGGRYRNAPVGSCRYSDITVFSFHPVKIITSAEGGMAVTNTPSLADKMARLRSHGITRNSSELKTLPAESWVYEQQDLGFNYRMPDILAALGLSQMERLDDYVTARNQLAERYSKLLGNTSVTRPYCNEVTYSAYHLYVVCLNQEEGRSSRQAVFDELRKAGIGVNIHYIPVHTQPVYRQLGFKDRDYPVAENYYSRAITLPLFPGLQLEEQDYIISQLAQLT